MDLNAFDQGADDLAFRGEVDRAQSVIDGGGKLAETIDYEKQLELSCLVTPGLFDLMIELFELDLQLPDLRIKVCFIDHPLRIAVNEP